jgi:two-component system, LytTR family, response regulator
MAMNKALTVAGAGRRIAGERHDPLSSVLVANRGGVMKVRVLIVDDEPLARQRVRRLLEADSEIAIVGESSDGEEAVNDLHRLRPDLVFLAVQMPVLDGFGVLQTLDNDPLPAVIFVTAHDRFALKAFEVHALDYLLKPFDKSRFATAQERLDSRQRQGRAGQ